MQELAQIVESGPDPKADGVVRWRRIDLVAVIGERFGIACSQTAVSDYLCILGFSHISGRPQHPAQDPQVIEAFKKNFANTLAAQIAGLPKDTQIELWFQE